MSTTQRKKDHTLVASSLVAGVARWEPFTDGGGELCMNGLRYATRLDDYGVPLLTETMRGALAIAKGQS